MSTTELEQPGGLALFDGDAYKASFSLRDEYGVPPLSVLDAASQPWQQRKNEWLDYYPQLLEEATPDNVFGSYLTYHEERGQEYDLMRLMKERGGRATTFDPFLAELCYSWWSTRGSLVYDPFAGGPVRGVVADVLGRQYLGVDVRAEQVERNYAAWPDGTAAWLHADASTYTPPARSVDFLMTCPPYGSLEQYSEQPDDLSTLPWADFCTAYRAAIGHAVEALRPDRFGCFVVGNFKDPNAGGKLRPLRDLVGVTCRAFEEAGAPLYTELVHMTPVGTTAIRTAFHFPRSLRPMPRHQMVLVFLKGDAKRAVAYCTGGQP